MRSRVGLVVAMLLLTPACGRLEHGSAGAGSSSDPGNTPAGPSTGEDYPVGTLVADTGFRPNSSGFTFENYGNVLPDGTAPLNLTPDDVRTMFGDEVCRDASATTCSLIPAAEQWLEQTNAEMSLGHCYGFALSSSLLWQGTLAPAAFGAPAPPALGIEDNDALQRRIAYDWAAQLLDSVRTKVLQGSPNQVLTSLRKLLRPNPDELYTIVFWNPDGTGGHAVTPFAVEDRGGGRFGVLIYDNNWPDETRAISFDTKANTWTYDAALNPDAPEEVYEGTEKSNNLVLFPASPGIGDQKCPFCDTRSPSKGSSAPSAGASASAAGSPGAGTVEIFLRSSSGRDHPNLLITDELGRRLGLVGGRLVQEIPGARVHRTFANQNWRTSIEPHYVVPADLRYKIVVDAGGLEHEDVATLGIIGPAIHASVRDIKVTPGDGQALVLEVDKERMAYSTSRSQTPTIRFGFSDDAAAYGFELRGLSPQPGTRVRLYLPIDEETLEVAGDGSTTTSHLSLELRRFTEAGVDVFRTHDVDLAGNDTAELRFGQWSGDLQERLPLAVKHGRDTTTTYLRNAAIPSGG